MTESIKRVATERQQHALEIVLQGGPVGPKGDPTASIVIKGVTAAWPPADAAYAKEGDLWVVTDPPPAGAPAWALAGHGAFWDGHQWLDAGPIQGMKGDRGEPGNPLNIKGTALSWVPASTPKPGDVWILPDPLPTGTPATFKPGGAAAWDDVAKAWIPLEAIRGPAGHSITVYGPSPVPPPTAEKGDIWLASDSSLFSATFDPSGITPIPGPAGPTGPTGPSAFEAWKLAASRPTASLQDFVDAIRGAAGSVGPKGEAGETLKVNGVVATAGDLPVTPPLLTVNVTSDDGHLWVYDPSSAAANAGGWNDLGKISGPAGVAAFLSASVASVTALPAKGAAGQMIFVTDVGHLYGWNDTTGAWVDGGKISDGSLDDGTAQGQMLVWDATAKRWTAADVLRLVPGTNDGDVPLWDVASAAYLSGKPQLKHLGDVLLPPDMAKADGWGIEYSDPLQKFTLVPHVQKHDLDRVELEALQSVMRNGMIRDTLPQPPHGPVMPGTVFLVGENPTGAWAGHANKLVIHDVYGKWVFESAQEGNTHYHDRLKTFITWSGTAWVPMAKDAAQGITPWSSDEHKVGAVVLWDGNLFQATADIARGSGAPGVAGPTLLLLLSNGASAGTTVTVDIAPQGGTRIELQYVAVAGDTDAATLAAHLAEALTADPRTAAIGIYQSSGSTVYAVGRGVPLTVIPATPFGVATTNTATEWRELSVGGIARLSDVALTPLADGQLLTYDLASKRWVNRSPNVPLAVEAYERTNAHAGLVRDINGRVFGIGGANGSAGHTGATLEFLFDANTPSTASTKIFLHDCSEIDFGQAGTIRGVADPATDDAVANKKYVDGKVASVVTGISHGVAVESITNTPPAALSEGNSYIVGTAPTGAWLGQANAVATAHNGGWLFVAPHTGDTHLNEADKATYSWSGTAWVKTADASAQAAPATTDALPVGAILMWPTATIPANYLELNGAKFDAVAFPDLYRALGADTLPDFRGQFVRGARPGNAALTKTTWTTARPRTNFTTDSQGNHSHTADTQGNHNHSFQRGSANFSGDIRYQDPTFSPINAHGGGNTIGGGINANGAHSHNISAAGAHAHTVTGGGDAETAPDHVFAVYIIKAKA